MGYLKMLASLSFRHTHLDLDVSEERIWPVASVLASVR
jgi:hypothetical protein